MRISDLSSGGNGTLPGMYVTQEGSAVQVYSLSWDRPTIIKILPAVEGGSIQPCWKTSDEVSDWIRTLPKYVRAAGTTRRISFDCSLSASEAQIFTESPYERMRRLFDQKSKMPGNAELKVMLFEGNQTRGPVMPKPSMFGVVQCTMFFHDGKDFCVRPKMNVLQVISRTGIQSLTRLLQQQTADGKSLLGDPLDPANRTMFLFQRKDVSPMVPLNWTLGTAGDLNISTDGREFKAHICYAVTPPANVITPGVEHIKQAWKPWDKILRKLSADEQLAQLCSAFDPWILKDAFMGSEFESRLPDFIKNAKVGAVMQPPQQYPQQVPQGWAPPQQQNWAPQAPQQYPQQAPQGWAQPQPQQPAQYPQQAPQQNWAPQQIPQTQAPNWAPQAATAQPFGNPFDMGETTEAPAPQQQMFQPAPPQGPTTNTVAIPTGQVNQDRMNTNIAALQKLMANRAPGT